MSRYIFSKKLLASDFEKKYGLAEQETSLFEVLWLCCHLFKDKEKNYSSRKIYLFTNEDALGDLFERQRALQFAMRLREIDVDIELFPLQKADGSPFDVSKFFGDLITINADEVNDSTLKTSIKSANLKRIMRQKAARKKCVANLDFDIAPGIKIAVELFRTIYPQVKPLPHTLDAVTNKPLVHKLTLICEETEAALQKDQIGSYFAFGDQKVFFSKQDFKEIKTFEPPSIKLMGFKPASALKPYHTVRTPFFIYPDEGRISGSSQLCDALIKQLKAKNKIGIVRIIPTSNSIARFAALLPQEESYDKNNNIQTPPGFHLVMLPYADDIRNLDIVKPKCRTEVDREQVVNAKLMIKKLSKDFDCKNFENHALQSFWENLKTIALCEEEGNEPQDLLQPDMEQINKGAKIVEEFKKSVFEKGNSEVKVIKVEKDDMEEKKSLGEEEKEIKRRETIEKDDYEVIDDSNLIKEESAEKVVEETLRNALGNLKVHHLKEYLASKNQSITGEKSDLVERLLEYLTK